MQTIKCLADSVVARCFDLNKRVFVINCEFIMRETRIAGKIL